MRLKKMAVAFELPAISFVFHYMEEERKGV